jgi:hypothetical protein
MHGWNWPKYLTGTFAFLWLFIGATSTVDAYLTVKYAGQLDEENPIGAALIEMGPHVGRVFGEDQRFVNERQQDVSLLVGAKMFGTILSLGILLLIFHKWPMCAQVIVSSLALFQFMLMFYIFR